MNTSFHNVKLLRILFNCSMSVDEIGDLYLDVAEAYMEQGYYKECKPILATLVDSEKYNLVNTCNMKAK